MDFQHTATIDSLFVKEPNHKDFIKYFTAKQLILGIHHDWNTFSFYELNVPSTLYTFRQRLVDFEIFHSKSMSFLVRDEDDVYHFQIIFSVSNSLFVLGPLHRIPAR